MEEFRIGDYVTRKSYGGDIFFRVEAIGRSQDIAYAALCGVLHRLYADASLDDLEKINPIEANMIHKRLKQAGQQFSRVMERQRSRYNS